MMLLATANITELTDNVLILVKELGFEVLLTVGIGILLYKLIEAWGKRGNK